MAKTRVPSRLKAFLRSLTSRQADALWLWLDGTPDAVEQMVVELVDSHPALTGSAENKKPRSSRPGAPRVR